MTRRYGFDKISRMDAKRKKQFKTFDTKTQVSARTVPSVRKAVDELVARFKSDDSLRLRGRPFSIEAVVSSALWHFMDMPATQREIQLRKYVEMLNAQLEIREPSEQPQPTETGRGLAVVDNNILESRSVKLRRNNKRPDGSR